ncbi:MAG: hypothetical protein AAGD10_15385 [Myxococcota bacterium]
MLSVIALTNESDQSVIDLDAAVDQLLSIKGLRNTYKVSFAAISGGESGCETDEGLLARPAPSLVELVDRTGGVHASICARDWSRRLEELSHTSPGGFGSRFFLTNQAVIGTVEVRVDDVMIPDREDSGHLNWAYDISTNSVNFLPLSVPGAGSKVQIRYQVACL